MATGGRSGHLVSMLGDGTNWVRNVRAAGYDVVLRRRGSERVLLQEVEVAERAPILRRYLGCAPRARPHFPVAKDDPLEAFERIAAGYPVFRVVTATRS